MLFTHLADDLFRPLASPSRAFNAALLLHLHRHVFGDAAKPHRKADLVAAIGDFCAGWAQADIADDEATPVDPIERRSVVYRRLLDAGWLVERRERYVPVVEFDPEARILIEELARLDRGETRSYGGAVLEVLGALESATTHPSDRSEALGVAARAARTFLAHLRGLAGAMRKVEERILHEEDPRAAFRLYFEDFVERHLVSDYRTLHTRFNPFRFRSGIVREAGRALRDPLTIRALAEANLREGRSRDIGDGERDVRRDLSEIHAIFENIDPHLDAVAEVVARLERRMAAALRYRDHRDSARIERTAAALRAVGAVSNMDGAPVVRLLLLRMPVGAPHLYAPRIARRAIPTEPLAEARIDPAIDAFIQAKDAFRLRTTVTRGSIAAFLDERLGEAGAIQGSQIVVEDVDAFVIFQRLREIDLMFDGMLGARYRLRPATGRIANGWLDCPDFLIERVEADRKRG